MSRPAFHPASRGLSLLASLAVATIVTAPARAQEKPRTDARWAAIQRVFPQQGDVEDGYYRINLPRSDLHVRIGADALATSFEFTSYLGFVPLPGNSVLATGEVIVPDTELEKVLSTAQAQGVDVTAVHNHLVGESPRIMYVHVMARGPAHTVAEKLHAVFLATATPMKAAAEEPDSGEWSAIDAVLGKHDEAHGHVAEYEFARREHLTVGGVAVKSSGAIESGSEAVFQQLAPGRFASTGELFVLPREVGPVSGILDEHGLHVTAIHNHMLDEAPTMYWIHWYGTGDGVSLARGVAAALEVMNSAGPRMVTASMHR